MRKFLAAVLLAAACKGSASSAPPPDPTGGMPLLGADCDPLVPQHCGLPFPSNVWLEDGKVTFGATTLPAHVNQAPLDGALFTDKDGFSPTQAAIVFLKGAVDDGLPTPDTIAGSLAPDSPTILMDAESGERIPHFI